MLIFLKKLPIPNLKHYCLFSLSLLFIVIIYTNKLIHDIRNERNDTNKVNQNKTNVPFESENLFELAYNEIMNEPWCVWVLVNFCYCVLIIISKILQYLFFGKLRALERQRIKDQFWNFIFLKFIFIFGVLNLDNINQVVIWCTWFSIIGFLSIHCQISKDRFEYLSFSATTSLKHHVKLLSLLSMIFFTCVYLLYASFYNDRLTSLPLSQKLFLFSEAFVLSLRSLYIITRYAIHLIDIYNLTQLNNKGSIQYYLDFVFEMVVISTDLLNYFHMLIYGNFYLSMASLVICMEIKRLIIDLQKRMKRHSNYLRVLEKMEKKIPWASKEELDSNDNKCAVCWDQMDKARRLPCSHMFHHNCLRSWLEQDTSCPTCRKSLQENKDSSPNQSGLDENLQRTFRPQRTRNLIQFNGSRYWRWLPNFSLQVINHNDLIGNLIRTQNIDTDTLNEMTNRVSQMFPNIAINIIQNDLRQTNSAELTIENILENRFESGEQENGFDFIEDETTSEDERSTDNQNDEEESSNLLRQRHQRTLDFESNNDQITDNLSQNISDLDSNLKISFTNPISSNLSTINMKKRELLFNSKRRFLEKQRAQESQKNVLNENM
ncbi:unnamed protein product [Brachionus calyciflorus]|uniref:Uncharacterized protein n=1 Tax=Brachionus calyciflorus TaxID=104777 RepID=A0A813QEX5_9BILA|nr:unnamed protein product [Brachionus calyciflorus]